MPPPGARRGPWRPRTGRSCRTGSRCGRSGRDRERTPPRRRTSRAHGAGAWAWASPTRCAPGCPDPSRTSARLRRRGSAALRAIPTLRWATCPWAGRRSPAPPGRGRGGPVRARPAGTGNAAGAQRRASPGARSRCPRAAAGWGGTSASTSAPPRRAAPALSSERRCRRRSSRRGRRLPRTRTPPAAAAARAPSSPPPGRARGAPGPRPCRCRTAWRAVGPRAERAARIPDRGTRAGACARGRRRAPRPPLSARETHSLGDDHDPLRADEEPLFVLLGIVSDLQTRRDVDVLVDDRAADTRAPADLDALEEDALLDVRVRVDADVRRDHRAIDPAAGDDASLGHQRVGGAADPLLLLVGENELRRRGGMGRGGVDGPTVVVERELGVDGDEIHVALVIRVEIAHVPPVACLVRALAGYVVRREVVDGNLRALVHLADDRLAEVVCGFLSRVANDLPHQSLGAEEIVAHGD